MTVDIRTLPSWLHRPYVAAHDATDPQHQLNELVKLAEAMAEYLAVALIAGWCRQRPPDAPEPPSVAWGGHWTCRLAKPLAFGDWTDMLRAVAGEDREAASKELGVDLLAPLARETRPGSALRSLVAACTPREPSECSVVEALEALPTLRNKLAHGAGCHASRSRALCDALVPALDAVIDCVPVFREAPLVHVARCERVRAGVRLRIYELVGGSPGIGQDVELRLEDAESIVKDQLAFRSPTGELRPLPPWLARYEQSVLYLFQGTSRSQPDHLQYHTRADHVSDDDRRLSVPALHRELLRDVPTLGRWLEQSRNLGLDRYRRKLRRFLEDDGRIDEKEWFALEHIADVLDLDDDTRRALEREVLGADAERPASEPPARAVAPTAAPPKRSDAGSRNAKGRARPASPRGEAPDSCRLPKSLAPAFAGALESALRSLPVAPHAETRGATRMDVWAPRHAAWGVSVRAEGPDACWVVARSPLGGADLLALLSGGHDGSWALDSKDRPTRRFEPAEDPTVAAVFEATARALLRDLPGQDRPSPPEVAALGERLSMTRWQSAAIEVLLGDLPDSVELEMAAAGGEVARLALDGAPEWSAALELADASLALRYPAVGRTLADGRSVAQGVRAGLRDRLRGQPDGPDGLKVVIPAGAGADMLHAAARSLRWVFGAAPPLSTPTDAETRPAASEYVTTLPKAAQEQVRTILATLPRSATLRATNRRTDRYAYLEVVSKGNWVFLAGDGAGGLLVLFEQPGQVRGVGVHPVRDLLTVLRERGLADVTDRGPSFRPKALATTLAPSASPGEVATAAAAVRWFLYEAPFE